MSEKIDTKNHPAVKALIAHQERLGDSDAAFARRYLRVSSASWSLLRSGTYGAKDPSSMLDRCESAVQLLNDQAEKAGSDAGRGKIIDLPHVRAAVSAVRGCLNEDQNRLVVYLAPSGGGKSALTRKLREVYLAAAVVVEATESWRKSYFNSLAAVAEALGLEKAGHPRALETIIVDYLSNTSRILCIDEGHYCGPESLNMLKMLLNKTGTRVVLCAIPQLWRRMEEAAYEEVLQLRRRTAAKIIVNEVSRSDARAFLHARVPDFTSIGDAEKEAVALVCTAANRFGLYDTLKRICIEMHEEADGHSISLDVVKAAISRVEALRS
jgi:DNA transposition AAA+ family ATPase